MPNQKSVFWINILAAMLTTTNAIAQEPEATRISFGCGFGESIGYPASQAPDSIRRVTCIDGLNIKTADIPAEDEIFVNPEISPTFPGGEYELLNFIIKNLQYPPEADKLGIRGRVFVRMTIEADGHILERRVVRCLGGGCDEEALRIIDLMPKWTPSMLDGKPIRSSYIIPFSFY